MLWAAAGSAMALCGYVLLFPVAASPLRALNFLALVLLTVLPFAARRWSRAGHALDRLVGSSPALLAIPVMGTAAASWALSCFTARSITSPLAELHEAVAVSLLAVVIATCGALTRSAPRPRRDAAAA